MTERSRSRRSAEIDANILITNPGADLYGSDRMMLETVAALVGGEHQVTVAVPADGPLIEKITERGARPVIVPTAIIRKSALRPAGFLRLLVDVMTGIRPAIRILRRERPQALIVNTITTPLWLVAAKLTRTPVIAHIHEGETGRPMVVRRALAAPLLLADQLVVNSEFSRGALVDCIPRLRLRSTVIYNAVVGPATVTPPRPVLDGPVRLLFVGRLSPRKGVEVLIDAISLLSERGVRTELDLVGAVVSGSEWFEDQLRGKLAKSGLADNVRFHGFCDDVWPFAAKADISVVPSTEDETFGNAAVEAALAARPLIVSATSGLLEATKGLGARVGVAAGSATELADAVQTIVDDWPQFADRAMDDAKPTADRFSQRRYAAAFRETIRSVTTSAPSPQALSEP